MFERSQININDHEQISINQTSFRAYWDNGASVIISWWARRFPHLNNIYNRPTIPFIIISGVNLHNWIIILIILYSDATSIMYRSPNPSHCHHTRLSQLFFVIIFFSFYSIDFLSFILWLLRYLFCTSHVHFQLTDSREFWKSIDQVMSKEFFLEFLCSMCTFLNSTIVCILIKHFSFQYLFKHAHYPI